MTCARAGIRFVTGVALFLAAAAASAQSPNAEQFDLTGITGNGLRQWAIKLQVIAHKSGDMKDAAKIQEELADYYGEKGDSVRARTATAAQALALQMLSGGGGGPPTQYPPVTPPTNPPVNPGDGGSTMPPSSNFIPPSGPPTNTPGGVTGPSASVSTDPGSTLQGSYTFTNASNGVQSTWDFSADGSYRYTKVGANSFSAPTTETGTYSISGGTLEMRASAASNAPGGAASNGTVHRYKVQVLGPGGRDGLILSGHQLQRKN